MEKSTTTQENATKLYSENENFAHYMVNKYFSHYIEQHPFEADDLHQEACLALWKSAQTYKPCKGYTFTTYASKCIYNQCLMYIGRNSDKRAFFDSMISIYEPISPKKDIRIEDIIPDDECQEDRVVTAIVIDNMLSHLNDFGINDRDIEIFKCKIESLYGRGGDTQTEVANKFGISQAQLSRIYKRVGSKLKEINAKELF